MSLHKLDILNSFAASNVELWRGLQTTPAEIIPEKMLQLYDIEDCPFCRLVRETLTLLDLDVVIYPCPRGGRLYRSIVAEKGGKQQFPFLLDPNNNRQMYESYDIIAYLMETYGQRPAPSKLKVKLLDTASSVATGMVRLFGNSRYRSARQPEKQLELYSFESSPFARTVRELLCQLEIPYILHNVGKYEWRDMLLPVVRESLMTNFTPLSKNRAQLKARTGKVQVPFLIDPNTGVELFESKQIKRYLIATYAD